MFWAKRQYFKPPRSCLGFCEETQNYAKRNRSQIFFFLLFSLFEAVSFRGQNLLMPHTPRWSALGFKFKISDEHPRLFHIGVPPDIWAYILTMVFCPSNMHTRASFYLQAVCPGIVEGMDKPSDNHRDLLNSSFSHGSFEG